MTRMWLSNMTSNITFNITSNMTFKYNSTIVVSNITSKHYFATAANNIILKCSS